MNFAATLYQHAIQRFAWPRLRQVCIAAITYDPVHPEDVDSWSMAGFAGEGDLRGVGVIEFLQRRNFEVVVLQHWPPAPMLGRLRAALPKAKFLGWVAVEAIRGKRQWVYGPEEQLREILEEALLKGTDGKPIDIYYGRPKSPIYAVDMLDAEVPDIVGHWLQEVRHVIPLDGWFFDSVTRHSYFAKAPNAPSVQDRLTAWPSVIQHTRRRDPKAIIWGNTVNPSADVGTELDVQFCEQYFVPRNTVEDAVAGLQDKIVLNTQRTAWVTRNRAWRFLAHEMAMRGYHNVYVCTAWTGQQNMNHLEWY